jgi:hypothetical protein
MNNLKIIGYLCVVALSCILFTTYEHVGSFWSGYFKIVLLTNYYCGVP